MLQNPEYIRDAIKKILDQIPQDVTVLAAVKKRNLSEVYAAIDAGIIHFGHNYVQEAQVMFDDIPVEVHGKTYWHLIGHLQKNKVKHAVKIFNSIDSVDSLNLGKQIDNFCQEMGKVMPILIEINSAREENKNGVFPENVVELIQHLEIFQNLSIDGLMTMGPVTEKPEDIRRYFRITRDLFDELSKIKQKNLNMHILSMGMSDSYRIAIEEGANLVRIGTLLFGPR